MTKELLEGTVHKLPDDLKQILTQNQKIKTIWQDLTPLARNEWICWITSAKKTETRVKRIERMLKDLENNKKRPCCWPGCPHR